MEKEGGAVNRAGQLWGIDEDSDSPQGICRVGERPAPAFPKALGNAPYVGALHSPRSLWLRYPTPNHADFPAQPFPGKGLGVISPTLALTGKILVADH